MIKAERRKKTAWKAKFRNIVPNSRWQLAVSVKICRSVDIKRMRSRLVPHWRFFRDRAFKLAAPWLSSLLEQAQRCKICARTRQASLSCSLCKPLFLEPYFLRASRLSDGDHPPGTLSAVSSAAPLARRGCKPQRKVWTCRFGRCTFLQAARVDWRQRRRALVFLPV